MYHDTTRCACTVCPHEQVTFVAVLGGGHGSEFEREELHKMHHLFQRRHKIEDIVQVRDATLEHSSRSGQEVQAPYDETTAGLPALEQTSAGHYIVHIHGPRHTLLLKDCSCFGTCC
jgi:hypothetical protein